MRVIAILLLLVPATILANGLDDAPVIGHRVYSSVKAVSKTRSTVRHGSGLRISNKTDVESNAQVKQQILSQISSLIDQKLKTNSVQYIDIDSKDYQGVKLIIRVDGETIYVKE